MSYNTEYTQIFEPVQGQIYNNSRLSCDHCCGSRRCSRLSSKMRLKADLLVVLDFCQRKCPQPKSRALLIMVLWLEDEVEDSPYAEDNSEEDCESDCGFAEFLEGCAAFFSFALCA